MCRILASCVLLGALSAPIACQTPATVPGAAVLLADRIDLIMHKRVGLVTNHTALLPDGRHLVDALRSIDGVRLTALFAPEHGIRGDRDARVEDTVDAATGVPVYSLYGRIRKPTPSMLAGLDVILFDIQDVGARFYTYSTTLGLTMEAAAETGIPLIVLDRPNPITGLVYDGPVTDDSLRSFVAFARVPILHGMTVGELATYYNTEGCLSGGLHARLTVVRAQSWTRSLWYDQTGLRWIPPSPNMPTLESAAVYPGVCLFEGTNVSEGRGTASPFLLVGAPWANGERLAELLNSAGLAGVRFETASFTPLRRPEIPSRPKLLGVTCRGVRIIITDRTRLRPVRLGVTMLHAFRMLHPDSFQWREKAMDQLAGTSALRTKLDQGASLEEICQMWAKDLDAFGEKRSRHLLYP